MELWDPLESLEELVNLVPLDSLVHLVLRVTWELQETRAVLAFRVLEEKQENPECQENQERWVLQERMVLMVKKGAQETLEHLAHQDFLDLGVNQALMEALVHQGLRA
jgi:hypothetical protein